MQPNFAKKKAKNKAKKAARKAKKEALKQQGGQDGDAEMGDASTGPGSEGGDAEVEDIDYTYHGPGGRAKHQAKVDLKRQLKVKVKQLKASRLKVTKLPGNKGARKQLGSQIKSLIAQQQEAGAKGAAAPAEKPGNGTMAE